MLKKNKLQFNEKLFLGEDTNFIYQVMSQSSCICVLSNIGYFYHVTSGNDFDEKYWLDENMYYKHIRTILLSVKDFTDNWNVAVPNVYNFLESFFFNLFFSFLSKLSYNSFVKSIYTYKEKKLYCNLPFSLSVIQKNIMKISCFCPPIGFLILHLYKYIKS